MNPTRKKKISDLANSISSYYFDKQITNLEAIASDEDVGLCYDHYEVSFDGMLVYSQATFYIHLNIDRGNQENSPRGRFSFAHELGHYFIDEHRLGLKRGELLPHLSSHEPGQTALIELEADYFAGCLLMPEFRFRQPHNRVRFSLDTIIRLADQFQTSVMATIIRFVEIGTHPIMVVVSDKGKVKWYAVSHDFPKWAFRFKIGNALPTLTVAGEFFNQRHAKYTGIENVDPEGWFYPGWDPPTQMHEQCYYSESYGYVISVVWFD